jgi:hypothetical protein
MFNLRKNNIEKKENEKKVFEQLQKQVSEKLHRTADPFFLQLAFFINNQKKSSKYLIILFIFTCLTLLLLWKLLPH